MLEGSARYVYSEVVALADALRLPLLKLRLGSQSITDAKRLDAITEHALKDIDAFIESYSKSISNQLTMQTIGLGSVMHDTAQNIRSYAKISGVKIKVDNHAQHQPVIANSSLLVSGLELVTKSMCDFASDEPEPEIILRSDTRHGYPRLGVYRRDVCLTAEDVQLAKKLIGGARINAGLFTQLAALRLVIADRLLQPLGIRLRKSQSEGSHGLAFQLLPSKQSSLFGL